MIMQRLRCAGKEKVGDGRNVRRKLTSTINEARPDLSMGELLFWITSIFDCKIEEKKKEGKNRRR